MYKSVTLLALLLAYIAHIGSALECQPPAIKVTVKITDPGEFDEYERYLFKGVVAYSMRKYCGSMDPEPHQCIPSLNNTDTTDVTIYNCTDRVAMCAKVEGSDAELLQDAIRESRPRFNGALVLTDDTLVVDGVPKILKAAVDPAFPTWLIPFIVFMSLVVIAAIVIISYTVYQTKKKLKNGIDSDDDESLTDIAYENPNDSTMFTEM